MEFFELPKDIIGLLSYYAPDNYYALACTCRAATDLWKFAAYTNEEIPDRMQDSKALTHIVLRPPLMTITDTTAIPPISVTDRALGSPSIPARMPPNLRTIEVETDERITVSMLKRFPEGITALRITKHVMGRYNAPRTIESGLTAQLPRSLTSLTLCTPTCQILRHTKCESWELKLLPDLLTLDICNVVDEEICLLPRTLTSLTIRDNAKTGWPGMQCKYVSDLPAGLKFLKAPILLIDSKAAILPAGLTSLVAIYKDSLLTVDGIGKLPRSLTHLECGLITGPDLKAINWPRLITLSLAGYCTGDFLTGLPDSLRHLTVRSLSLGSCWTASLPRGLVTLTATGPWDAECAAGLPDLARLTFSGKMCDDDIPQLPKTLTQLNVHHSKLTRACLASLKHVDANINFGGVSSLWVES